MLCRTYIHGRSASGRHDSCTAQEASHVPKVNYRLDSSPKPILVRGVQGSCGVNRQLCRSVLDLLFSIRVQQHGADRLPVTRWTRPPFRLFLFGSFVLLMSLEQALMVQSSMPLSRCDEPDTAMPVLVVVSPHEVPHPCPCGVQTGKTILRPLRAVFQRSEQRLRVGIVSLLTRGRPREGVIPR